MSWEYKKGKRNNKNKSFEKTIKLRADNPDGKDIDWKSEGGGAGNGFAGAGGARNDFTSAGGTRDDSTSVGGVGDGSTGAYTEGVSFESFNCHFVGARLGRYMVFTSEEAPRGVEESTLNFAATQVDLHSRQ